MFVKSMIVIVFWKKILMANVFQEEALGLTLFIYIFQLPKIDQKP